MENKKPLYVFLHVFKCAGSSIRKHVEDNFDEGEFFLTYGYESPFLIKRKGIKKYINSLTNKQKNKLKIILGHTSYYGIHKLFPNREVRYVTFLRDPIKRAISHYNFRRQRFDKILIRKEFLVDSVKHSTFKKNLRRLKKLEKNFKIEFFKNKNLRSFSGWYLFKDKLLQNFMFKFLFSHFFYIGNGDLSSNDGEFGNIKGIKINNENFKKLRKILDKFYFVGLTENKEDFLYLYYLLGIKKYFPKSNVSKKYFMPKNFNKIKKLLFSGNKYDLELYNYTKRLNKKFKEKNKYFNFIVFQIKIRYIIYFSFYPLRRLGYYLKEFYHYIIKESYFSIRNALRRTKIYISNLPFKISAKLKEKSERYERLVKLIKQKTGIK